MRTATIGAALALLMSTAAWAQTGAPTIQDPATLPPPELQAPSIGEEPGQGTAPTASTAMPSTMDRDMRRDRRGDMRARHSMGMGDGGRMGRFHHGRAGMDRGGERDRRGASFTFSQGNGGPSITIECADRDTTLECANAVMPMLELMQPASSATPTP